MTGSEAKVFEALAESLNGDPAHAFQVRTLALALFDQTASLHGLDSAARLLLDAAALLHDIGLCNGAAEHHKHSRDMILKLDMPGVSATEREMIACIARYHRKAHPAPAHKVFRELDPIQQGTVTILSALLRVADGLDRSHASNVRELRVRIEHETLRVEVMPARPCELDLWGARRKAELCEAVFGRRLKITAVN